ncbi:6-aminohexanoate hydrolase [Aquimarina atlantica]|uniref:6-aminohexanoate hydrolase n=1 Tax=Aquimarina atlantica TaxID=1317122 RepID=A0A023BRB5_9FLAO|nr:serine hydrolase [Aquimarina atlantica]EZH72353.1 6-aminohexanoate hydrolase [Aquimarina atlantica]
MKKSLLTILIVFFSNLAFSQKHLTAEESDPNTMGWMQGFPPSKERLALAEDGSFFTFPELRYSVCHMRQFLPTTEVASAQENRYEFRLALDTYIDSLTFKPLNSNQKITWVQSLPENYTDGVIILHKGNIVYEKYFGALKPKGVHAAMSVSKTFTGTLGAMLVAEGVLDENKTAAAYIPELGSSAFGDATIRQILDMTTSLKYSEDYSDPNAEVWIFSAAGNPLPKAKEYNGPKNYIEYLQTVKKDDTQHGEVFAYKTINTDAMGWIVSRATGKSIPQLLSERIWKPLGTHIDGYYQVDASGIAFAGGGFSANMRDMAMFGEMIRNKGFFNNQQILPISLIEDIMKGGNQDAFQKSAYTSLKNWSYRNMWWITHNKNGAFAARGVHGQIIYIDPMAEMVIVRFASHPEAKNSKIDPTSLPAYQAVADYLMQK